MHSFFLWQTGFLQASGPLHVPLLRFTLPTASFLFGNPPNLIGWEIQQNFERVPVPPPSAISLRQGPLGWGPSWRAKVFLIFLTYLLPFRFGIFFERFFFHERPPFFNVIPRESRFFCPHFSPFSGTIPFPPLPWLFFESFFEPRLTPLWGRRKYLFLLLFHLFTPTRWSLLIVMRCLEASLF